jgi:hypothetical protein
VKAISQFFRDLGFPLRNARWSWGARHENQILLRAWSDEYWFKEKKLRVLDSIESRQSTDSYGLDERILHLKALWDGSVAGYAVIATARDPNVSPREIIAYRQDAVFAINNLQQNSSGDIVAQVGDLVPVANLLMHAEGHRTSRNERPFPV